MSRNISARSGNGDATINYRKEPDSTSEASSYRGRTGLEGPYGDSPPQYQNEFFILMLNEIDGSTQSSEFEDNNQLYSLNDNYIQKLNNVRKRLNLIDIREGSDSSSHQNCRITDIVQVLPSKEDVCLPENNIQDVSSHDFFTDKYEHLLNCFSDNFEHEYSPPKKKSCQWKITPRICHSEKNISEFDEIISNTNEFYNVSCANQLSDYRCKFTKNEETQCSYDQVKSSLEICKCNLSQYDLPDQVPKSLFPKVIIKNYPSKKTSTSSVSTFESLSKDELIYRNKSYRIPLDVIQQNEDFRRITSPTKAMNKCCKSLSRPTKENEPPNYIVESTDDQYNTGTTSTTTILEKNPKKIQFWNKKYKSQRNNFWSHFQKFYLGRLQGGAEIMEKQYLANKQKFPTSLSGYNNIQYKKAAKITRMKQINHYDIPLAPKDIVDTDEFHELQQRYFYFSSDTDYHSSVFDSDISNREKENFSNCWEGFLKWINTIFSKHN